MSSVAVSFTLFKCNSPWSLRLIVGRIATSIPYGSRNRGHSIMHSSDLRIIQRPPAVRREAMLAACDVAAMMACMAGALLLRFGGMPPEEHIRLYGVCLPVSVLIRLFFAERCGLYDFRHRLTLAEHAFSGLGAAIAGVACGYIALALIRLYYTPANHLSRLAAPADAVLLAAWFICSRAIVLAWLRRTGYRVRVAVIGPAGQSRALMREMQSHAPKLMELSAPWDALEAADALANTRVDAIVLVSGDLPQARLHQLLSTCDTRGIEAYLYPELGLPLLLHTRVASLAQTPLISLNPDAMGHYRLGKRALDIAAAIGGMVLLSPAALLAALFVRFDSGPPILYSQERLGLHGRAFRIYKFRTMNDGAENGSGPLLAQTDDPRITRAGHFLRRYRMDEIPQLWNVLRGDMSLVGPRPERPEFAARFITENPLYERRLLVKPGLTGLAQIHGRYDMDYTQKLRYDLLYLNSASLAADLRILFATIRTVATGRGAR